MAVSLAWYSQDPSRVRERRATLPQQLTTTAYTPGQWTSQTSPQYQQTFPPPPSHSQKQKPKRHSVTSTPQYYQPQSYHQAPPHQRASVYCESPVQYDHKTYIPESNYCDSPLDYDLKSPRLPQRRSKDAGPQTPRSPKVNDSLDSFDSLTQSLSAASIEPDPLPPHSNPQVLGQLQSQAFLESQRIPPVRVGKDELYNSVTGDSEFRISREGARVPSMSTKPYLTITKTARGFAIGNIRFQTSASNNIELTINGRTTSISHSGVLHNRWGFQSTTSSQPEKWYWKKERSTNGAVLEDAKRNGYVIARMKGDLLTFERPRLSEDAYDEVVMSAIAMAEAARRQRRKGDIADIAAAIGDFTENSGGSGTDGNNGTYSRVENVDFEIRR